LRNAAPITSGLIQTGSAGTDTGRNDPAGEAGAGRSSRHVQRMANKMAKDEIVWIENPLNYTYLREQYHESSSPRFPIKNLSLLRGMEKIIGYQIMSRKKNCYEFRFWYVRRYDRDIDPNGVYKNSCPSEAVIPDSICRDSKSKPYLGKRP